MVGTAIEKQKGVENDRLVSGPDICKQRAITSAA